jgi:SAM-dependent methyltransferase
MLHQSAFDKMRVFVDKYLMDYSDKPLLILDVGSYTREAQITQKKLFGQSNWVYKGLDIENGENVDIIVRDPYDWKEIESNSFDVVISNQTFEHIPFFWITTFEIGRVLKEGGLACIIAPSSGGEHRFPLDTFRYYPDGFSSLCDYLGFIKIEIYRQDIDLQYPDGSDPVKDCCIIMRKPIFSDSERKNYLLRNFAHKYLLKNKNTLDFNSFEIHEFEKKISINSSDISCITDVKPKDVFLELEKERLAKITSNFVRKRKIKACIPILINNIFGTRAAKYIFRIYPKMEYWS